MADIKRHQTDTAKRRAEQKLQERQAKATLMANDNRHRTDTAERRAKEKANG